VDVEFGVLGGCHSEVVHAAEAGGLGQRHDLVDELLALLLAVGQSLQTLLHIFLFGWVAEFGGDVGEAGGA